MPPSAAPPTPTLTPTSGNTPDPTPLIADIALSLDKASQALHHAAQRLRSHPEDLSQALTLLLATTTSTPTGKLVFAGVGKSYLIGRKLAATMMSTGTYAISLHATDALHGDLGVMQSGDCLVALSYSGATEEVVRVAESVGRRGVRVVGMGGERRSPLGRLCDAWIACGVPGEMSAAVAAPTCSSAVMMAMGDAIAVMMMERRRFGPTEFARNHPAGELGRVSRKTSKQQELEEI
ncbi:hypothetical protein LPJ53_005357 [Coemansia erecta]|uniref:SIS domain-containing protein n=1 Tax=Coemansia erecta TaxID=147472 RepID=A0A9W7XSL9_9FUNG|nr:hypothetical protein LPJ53_005357 [Coemansia erecta]